MRRPIPYGTLPEGVIAGPVSWCHSDAIGDFLRKRQSEVDGGASEFQHVITRLKSPWDKGVKAIPDGGRNCAADVERPVQVVRRRRQCVGKGVGDSKRA